MVKPSSGTIRVALTGDMCVQVDGDVVASKAFPGRQGRLMFAYLAANHRPVSRDELADVIWSGEVPPHWKRDLSALASRLRTLLTGVGLTGSTVLVGAGDWYELQLPDSVEVDLDLAVTRLRDATEALAAGDAPWALEAAHTAMTVARRPFLPGEDADWIEARRQLLLRTLHGALDVTVAALEQRDEITSALEFSREAVELSPFTEHGYSRLMRLHLKAGDRAEALRTFHYCRELLTRELGVDPGPELQAAYLEVLRSNLTTRNATSPLEVPASDRIRGRLPVPVDRFVGRGAELECIATALASARLVTLTGVGGVGKSRLALESGIRLAPANPDGAWLCELSPVTAGSDVAHALANDLGVTPEPGVSTEESVERYLRDKKLLLIVDNCEHVLDSVAVLLRTLLLHCSGLSVLATSRERLGAGGEHVIEVPPLAVPALGTTDLSSAAGVEAVELFSARAAAQTGFTLTSENVAAVAEICRRLDGIPLALELAAARVAALGVRDVATRLDQRFWLLRGKTPTRPARSRSLQATVDCSYDMLTAEQQRVFDRLSVFVGRFTLAAAEATCADDQTGPPQVVDAVLTLADKSMLVVYATSTPTRYRLLETLREYGQAKLTLAGDATRLADRHADYFVAEAERLAHEMRGPGEASAVAALDACFDDVRAAHRWALAHREADLAVRLSGALYWYGLFHQRSEVFAWAEEALPLAKGHPDLSRVCATAGVGAWARGDRGRAQALGETGVAEAEDPTSARLALDVLGSVAFFEGRLADAASLWEQALEVGQQSGDDFHASHMAGNAALAHGYQGRRGRALRLAAVANEIATRTGNPTSRAWARYVHGEILMEDEPQRALPSLEESLRLARAVDNRFLLGVALLSASSLRGRHGDPHEAVPMVLEAIRHWQHAGNWTQQWTTLRNVIELFVRLGAHEPAAVLMGGVEAAVTAAPVFGLDAERMTEARRTLSTRLGSPALASLTAQGEAMEPPSVVRFACAELTRVLAGRED